jgi:DNA-binding XRE family transcriptional regulator
MTQANLGERVGVDRTTIGKLEAGDPGTSLSTVLRVLSTLGLDQDIDRIAATDEVGAQLAASSLRRPSPRRRKAIPAAGRVDAYPSNQVRSQDTYTVAESESDRYALRASRRPPPINVPLGQGKKPRGGK